jgi:hypothetical protein
MALETMANVHLTRGGMSLPARSWNRVNLCSSLNTVRLTVTDLAMLWIAHKICRLLYDQVLRNASCDRSIALQKAFSAENAI